MRLLISLSNINSIHNESHFSLSHRFFYYTAAEGVSQVDEILRNETGLWLMFRTGAPARGGRQSTTAPAGLSSAMSTLLNKSLLFLSHAINQMNAPERMISTHKVRAVIAESVVIEDYPEDVRGHSCLLLGYGHRERPIHLLCAPKPEYLAITTAYLPTLAEWESDWQTRKEP